MSMAFRHKLAIVLCAACAAPAAWVIAAETPSSIPPDQPVRFARIPCEPLPLPPVDSAADSGVVLTLAEAEAIAIANHPAMLEAEGLVRAARGQWLQAGLRPNPRIGYSGEEIGDEGRAGMQGGYFSQEFVTARKLGLNRAVAQREIAAAEQRFERTRNQVITSVRMYYYEALAAERAVALADILQQVATQALQASDIRLKALEGTQAAVLQSQVQSDSTQLLLIDATNRRDAARRRLASLLGTGESSAAGLQDTLGNELPVFDWEAIRTRLLSENPDLAELRFNVDRARWAVERASVERIPNVTVQSGAQYDYHSQFAMANLQISLPVPIFDRNQGGVASAYGQLTAAQSALDARELALTQQLATAMADYNTAVRSVDKYSQSILPAARQSLDLVSTAYEQGELEYLDILNIQRIYTERNLDYLRNLEAAWKKWAEIDGLLVGPLPMTGI